MNTLFSTSRCWRQSIRQESFSPAILPSLLFYFLLLAGCSNPTPSLDPSYQEAIDEWREGRVTELTAPDGWMALAGLFWLDPGANTFGSDAGNDLVFPVKAPARIGVFHLAGDSVRMTVAPEVIVELGDSLAVTETVFKVSDPPLIFHQGALSWFLIERGGRYGIRLRDAENENLQTFAGIESYPLDPEWIIPAEFVPFTEPETLLMRNVLDMELPYPTEGRLVFTKNEKEYALTVLDGGPGEYFLIFADETTGEETYGAGRYLYAPKADKNGGTVIDFNKAFNPPCAFTSYATCLLPPPQNRLDLAVRAGERKYENVKYEK